MLKYFSANNTGKFVDVVDLLVDQYNNSIHSSIKMTPNEASRKENENKVWRNLYPEMGGKTLTPNFRLVIMLEEERKRKYLIKNTLKDGLKRFLQFLKFN